MKQIFITNGGPRALEVPLPTAGDNELLVAVCASVISTGTETMNMRKEDKTIGEKLREKKEIINKVRQLLEQNGFKNTIEAIKNKLSPSEQALLFQPVGYSNTGIVVSKGNLVTDFNVGDRVACAGAGIAAHAEYSAVPVNLAVKVPEEVSYEAASFTTIGAIAMQGIRRANLTFGETVVITGLGLLGLLAVQIAKAWGLSVIGSDINPGRLELAKQLGADCCLNARDPNFKKHVMEFTHGHGADAVIIYASTRDSSPANQALDVCRKRGRVVVVGAVGMDLHRDSMYSNELDFVMSTSYGPGRYDKIYELKGVDYPIGYVRWTENRNMIEFVNLLARGAVKVEQLISRSFTIDQAQEAYRILVENPTDNISCLFNYQHREESIPIISYMVVKPNMVTSEKIRVGIVGAGSFIQMNHLANILELPRDYEVVAIAEKTTSSAKSISEKYKPKYVTTDYKQLLNDPSIDLIIIGTRHNLHAKQVIDAITSGKNVLVEKPLAMNHEEVAMIEAALAANHNTIVTVGFNRRYSPLTQKVKSIIENNTSPIVINYRVNAGYLPPDIWIQDLEEGGGRIIGEVCHFIDLIVYLVSDNIKTINAIHIPPDGYNVKSEDNVIISLEFEKGSIGVLTYTSIGGQEMEKERLEIFINGGSMVIRDFVELQTFNCHQSGISLKKADKGHKVLIKELSKKLRDKDSLILPFDRDIEITKLTLAVLDQIHTLNKTVK